MREEVEEDKSIKVKDMEDELNVRYKEDKMEIIRNENKEVYLVWVMGEENID